MVRICYSLLFLLFASNVFSQVYTFKVLGCSIHNDSKWTDYLPEKNLVYVYYDLDSQDIRIYDKTTDKSSIYKCWEIEEPFIKDKEDSYSMKATQVIGDLVLHHWIQFVFSGDSTQLYITLGDSITMWNLEFVEIKDSSTPNNHNKRNSQKKGKILKKNPNFNLE